MCLAPYWYLLNRRRSRPRLLWMRESRRLPTTLKDRERERDDDEDDWRYTALKQIQVFRGQETRSARLFEVKPFRFNDPEIWIQPEMIFWLCLSHERRVQFPNV